MIPQCKWRIRNLFSHVLFSSLRRIDENILTAKISRSTVYFKSEVKIQPGFQPVPSRFQSDAVNIEPLFVLQEKSHVRALLCK